MKLKPLAQWLCDSCGEIIEEPRHGFFVFEYDSEWRAHGFRITHHNPNVPGPIRQRSCHRGSKTDLPLEDVLGTNGMAYFLGMLARPALDDLKAAIELRALNVGEWLYTFRRLYTPYFEEARAYFSAAYSDGFFDGENEVWPYSESDLKRVIEKYGD